LGDVETGNNVTATRAGPSPAALSVGRQTRPPTGWRAGYGSAEGSSQADAVRSLHRCASHAHFGRELAGKYSVVCLELSFRVCPMGHGRVRLGVDEKHLADVFNHADIRLQDSLRFESYVASIGRYVEEILRALGHPSPVRIDEVDG
jgi:hypothetical protein